MAGKAKKAYALRGQLGLQISAKKYFRPDVELYETPQRQTFFTNVALIGHDPVDLSIGRVIPTTDFQDVNSVLIEAVDRQEAEDLDGRGAWYVSTNSNEIVTDIAHVATFVLNRTFSSDHDQVRRLTSPRNLRSHTPSASVFFPELFAPDALIAEADWDRLRSFLNTLVGLERETFAAVMRAIRRSVEATRRAVDDPTGAYVDLVTALESLADADSSSPTTWERYDGRKRKLLDPALEPLADEDAERVKSAILLADHAGLKRRFVSSTLAHVAPSFYREDATRGRRAPRAPDLDRMLSIAYDIRSRRSHVLEDLPEETWRINDGAETTWVANAGTELLTHPGLWRLVRHVVSQRVATAPQTDSEAWDYREALPGIVRMRLAAHLWVDQPGVQLDQAMDRLLGSVESYIEVASGRTEQNFNLSAVVAEIEDLVPTLPESDDRTALVALHLLWHTWIDPADVPDTARAFTSAYKHLLEPPSLISFILSMLRLEPYPWSLDEWRHLALTRRHDRQMSKDSPVPQVFDVLLQLVTADYLEEAGRHDDALEHAAYAVEEAPGDEEVLAWEQRLANGDHAPDFPVERFTLRLSQDEYDDLHGKQPAADEDVTAGSEA